MAGFTVRGKVMTHPKGLGIAFVKVLVNGQQVTSSIEDGTFSLDSMKAGSYKIDLLTNGIYFDSTTVKVTPNSPELPEIYASRSVRLGRALLINLFLSSLGSIFNTNM